MDFGVKNKVAFLVCFICFLEVSVTLQDKNEATDVREVPKDILRQGLVKHALKRSPDWSKRLYSSSNVEGPIQVAAESENVEVTSKAPRIIRKMRIQHGRQQNIETFKQINPESRSSEGGARIVRVKKFKRKPTIKTTIAPETTTTSTSMPSTINSMLTSSSPYSHITVINKEIRNPKKKQRNKKKRLNNQYVPTHPYDSEHEFMYVTALPDIRPATISHSSAYRFNAPNTYPEYGGYYSERRQPVVSNTQNKFEIDEASIGYRQDSPRMNENYDSLQHMLMRRMPQSISNDRNMAQSNYETTNFMTNRKQSAPGPNLRTYENSQLLKPSESRTENLKNVSPQQEKIQNDSKKLKIEIPPIVDEQTNKQVTVQRAGDSPTTVPAISEEKSVQLNVKNETSNDTISRSPNVESVLQPGNTAIQDERNFRLQQYRFPSRFPSLLYNRQNLFSDPYFDTPDMVSPIHRTSEGMTSQVMSPLRLAFSSFEGSNEPQRGGYAFDRDMQPYQSDELIIPGFQHSPHFTSLRRSIIDTYGDETSTSEPVTPFSLPKFEMPSIDFNDKGCQTAYKEVKTVPSDGVESRNNNAKSFIMTRECYFPNGLPTAEKTNSASTTTPQDTTKAPKRQSKDMKIDSKEP